MSDHSDQHGGTGLGDAAPDATLVLDEYGFPESLGGIALDDLHYSSREDLGRSPSGADIARLGKDTPSVGEAHALVLRYLRAHIFGEEMLRDEIARLASERVMLVAMANLLACVLAEYARDSNTSPRALLDDLTGDAVNILADETSPRPASD